MTPSPIRQGRGPHWRVATVLVAVLAGAGLTTVATAADGTDLRPVTSGLPDLIRGRDRAVEDKAQRVSRLDSEVRDLTTARAPMDERVRALTQEADGIAPAAGGVAVQGPGVSVALDDSYRDPAKAPPGFTAADLVVHQQDVEAVVNALWRGGAEAMSIQDQRITSTSAVRCVGNTLRLEGRVYAPPYVITAIGDPASLQAALDADPTVRNYRQYVQAVGLGYTMTPKSDVTVPAFAGPVGARRANVVR